MAGNKTETKPVDEAAPGTGLVKRAAEAYIKKRGQMKPADCALMGKDYDPETKQCVG